MSDPQPDPEKQGNAPEGPRNPWVGWLMWLILAAVLYVLSIGPASWLLMKGLWPTFLNNIYAPFSYLPDYILELVKRYAEWWLP